MQGVIRRGVTGLASLAMVLGAAGGMVILSGALQAAWACNGTVSAYGACLDGVETDPTNSTSPRSGGGGSAGAENASEGSDEEQVCKDFYTGESVPCSDPDVGTWFPEQNCLAILVDPQPPAGSPLWEGHRPSEGTVWGCDPSYASPDSTFFLPEGETADPVDGQVVARRLVERAPFEFADAHVAPPPSYHTYVHYKNWMWIPEDQWHDVSVSLSVNGATVSLRAEPTRVEWDMGPETVYCPGPGRAWRDGMPEDAPTYCFHTYPDVQDPSGDTWPVSARITYSVGWTCSGLCLSSGGDLGEVTALAGEETSMEVRQRQTVVIQ